MRSIMNAKGIKKQQKNCNLSKIGIWYSACMCNITNNNGRMVAADNKWHERVNDSLARPLPSSIRSSGREHFVHNMAYAYVAPNNCYY